MKKTTIITFLFGLLVLSCKKEKANNPYIELLNYKNGDTLVIEEMGEAKLELVSFYGERDGETSIHLGENDQYSEVLSKELKRNTVGAFYEEEFDLTLKNDSTVIPHNSYVRLKVFQKFSQPEIATSIVVFFE